MTGPVESAVPLWMCAATGVSMPLIVIFQQTLSPVAVKRAVPFAARRPLLGNDVAP